MYDELKDYNQFQWTIGICFLVCPHCIAEDSDILKEVLILAYIESDN